MHMNIIYICYCFAYKYMYKQFYYRKLTHSFMEANKS